MIGMVAPVAKANQIEKTLALKEKPSTPMKTSLTGNRANDHQQNIPTIGKFMLENDKRKMKMSVCGKKTYDFEWF